jgi:hypothetical protein
MRRPDWFNHNGLIKKFFQLKSNCMTMENKQLITDNTGHGDQECFPEMYAQAKALYKCGGNVEQLLEAAQQMLVIEAFFHARRIFRGEVFCKKGSAIIYREIAFITPDLDKKIPLLETANDFITEALILAEKNSYSAPALQKQQLVIKSALGDALHTAGDHRNANQLETTVFKTISKVLNEYPDYPEMYLELASASYRKIKWSLHKILADLGRAEDLLEHPKHTKHTPDALELAGYNTRIAALRQSINNLLTNARVEPGIQ